MNIQIFDPNSFRFVYYKLSKFQWRGIWQRNFKISWNLYEISTWNHFGTVWIIWIGHIFLDRYYEYFPQVNLKYWKISYLEWGQSILNTLYNNHLKVCNWPKFYLLTICIPYVLSSCPIHEQIFPNNLKLFLKRDFLHKPLEVNFYWPLAKWHHLNK